jgi:ferredoxin-NADP reductase
VLDVSAPAGDFVLTPTESPLLLASAGAGITTVLPIVEHIARTQPQHPGLHVRPLPFMRLVRSTLLDRGVPPARIRYEVFGPDLWAPKARPTREVDDDSWSC